uniref:Transposase n=1 Tax=Romanomermis culicivorax TaxID=13658 RepID=A0A915HX04_ROMCU
MAAGVNMPKSVNNKAMYCGGYLLRYCSLKKEHIFITITVNVKVPKYTCKTLNGNYSRNLRRDMYALVFKYT